MIGPIEQALTAALHRLAADGRPLPHKLWQRTLSKAARAVLPAPHRSHWMEWEYGTWVGAFAGFDEVGRQLGEANVLPEWMAVPLDDRWRPFKGPGIRYGHPFNIDAMQEMAHCWDGLLQDAARLRALYCQRYQRAGVLSALDLYVMTSVAVSLSSFLLRRGDAPVADGGLPRRAAAAFKVLGGMYAATNRMMSQAHPLLLQEQLDVDEFLQYLEDEQLLLSPEMRACGGPVKMIRQMLITLIEPPAEQQPPKPAATEGLDYLGAEIGRAFDYGICCVRIDSGVLLEWRALREQLRPLRTAAGTPAAALTLLEQETELGIDDEIPLAAYLDIATRLLARIGSAREEQAFLATLSACPPLAALELAVRQFARFQQPRLDAVLQRTARPFPNSGSPTPGSAFLQRLLKADPQVAARFAAGIAP